MSYPYPYPYGYSPYGMPGYPMPYGYPTMPYMAPPLPGTPQYATPVAPVAPVPPAPLPPAAPAAPAHSTSSSSSATLTGYEAAVYAAANSYTSATKPATTTTASSTAPTRGGGTTSKWQTANKGPYTIGGGGGGASIATGGATTFGSPARGGAATIGGGATGRGGTATFGSPARGASAGGGAARQAGGGGYNYGFISATSGGGSATSASQPYGADTSYYAQPEYASYGQQADPSTTTTYGQQSNYSAPGQQSNYAASGQESSLATFGQPQLGDVGPGTRLGFPAKRGGLFGGRGGRGGRGGNRGPFVPREKTMQQHYCDICKIACAGPDTYESHLAGQKHKKKAEQAKAGGDAGNQAGFRCDVCNITCSSSDTLDAHNRGKAHQKALNMYTRMGKPIPTTSPAKDAQGSVLGAGNASQLIAGLQKYGFIGGSAAGKAATGVNAVPIGPVDPNKPDGLDAQTIGEEYLEPQYTLGRLTGYHCRICDCSFTDVAARNVHAKGRRHRTNYKKKVDPTIEVEPLKPFTLLGGNVIKRKAEEFRQRKELMRLRTVQIQDMKDAYDGAAQVPTPYGRLMPLFPAESNFPALFPDLPRGPPLPFYVERENVLHWIMSSDEYVMGKHSAVYPKDLELEVLLKLVTRAENALKSVSDIIATSDTTAGAATEDRSLRGVQRVGTLANGTILTGELNGQLVLLCNEKPTRRFLQRVFDLFKECMKDAPEKYEFYIFPDYCCFSLNTSEKLKASVMVTLTSHVFREPENDTVIDSVEILNKQKCLEALAELRHTKWFQARLSSSPACIIILRVLRDLCKRVPTWTPLDNWSLQLLVEKIMTGSGMPLSPGESLARIFEAVSAGILLPGGAGLLDPCEKEPVNALAKLHPQQLEDITASAQHALRLIQFNQINKILGMELLPRDGGPVPPAPPAAEKEPSPSEEVPAEPAAAVEKGAEDTSGGDVEMAEKEEG